MNTQNIDVAELRGLIRHMTAEERDELQLALVGGEQDFSRLASHELERLKFLLKKLEAEWPYCERGEGVTLLEMLVAFSDDEMSDYLLLHRLSRGGERPPEHPYVGGDDYDFKLKGDKEMRGACWTHRFGPPHWTPDQPLHVAQRIVSGGGR